MGLMSSLNYLLFGGFMQYDSTCGRPSSHVFICLHSFIVGTCQLCLRPPLPKASERPPPSPLTRTTTRGTDVVAVSSRMTPVEHGPQQMSGPTKQVTHIEDGRCGSFRHRGQCLSGEPMPTQDTESVKGAVTQAQDAVHVRRG